MHKQDVEQCDQQDEGCANNTEDVCNGKRGSCEQVVACRRDGREERLSANEDSHDAELWVYAPGFQFQDPVKRSDQW
jgi:hypothetical protein